MNSNTFKYLDSLLLPVFMATVLSQQILPYYLLLPVFILPYSFSQQIFSPCFYLYLLPYYLYFPCFLPAFPLSTNYVCKVSTTDVRLLHRSQCGEGKIKKLGGRAATYPQLEGRATQLLSLSIVTK